jgi:hypothetical protein
LVSAVIAWLRLKNRGQKLAGFPPAVGPLPRCRQDSAVDLQAHEVVFDLDRHGWPSPARGATGAKMGANVLRHPLTQRDPLGALAQVRMRSPRLGFAQTRAYPPDLLRDEEAAGSIRPPRRPGQVLFGGPARLLQSRMISVRSTVFSRRRCPINSLIWTESPPIMRNGSS